MPHAQSLAEPARRASAPAADRRLLAAALAGLTLIAAALHLPFLGSQSFWFDETYTVHVVGAGSLGQLWDLVGATESTPPLFYLVTWAWVHTLGSEGEAGLRAVSALSLTAAVPVAWFALRRLTGAYVALATAALLAVSPLIAWYALDARAYGLLVLTGLLSVWTCAAVLERATSRRLALWALAAAAAVWTHWFAGFLVVGEVAALLWLAPAARRGVLLAAGAALVALVPLLPLLHEQAGDDRAAFIGDDSLLDRVEQLVRQFAAGPNVPRTWLEAACLTLALLALAAGTLSVARRARASTEPPSCSVVAGRPQNRTVGSRDGARALLAITAVALLLPLALAATGIYDRFNVRNVIFLWPLAAALAAPALLRLRSAPLAAALLLGALTTIWVQSDWRYGNTDWRGAIERSEAVAPGLPVVAVTRVGQPVAALYLNSTPASAAISTRRAWLLVEPVRGADSRALAPADAPLVASLLAAFPLHTEQRLHGFRLIALAAPAPVVLDPAQLSSATLLAAGESP